MKMTELKATLQGGCQVSITVLDNPVITLRKSSGDQREGDYNIRFSVEEWAQVVLAVRELSTMVEGKAPIGSLRG